MQPGVPVETAARVYRRYLKLEPSHVEEYIAYLKAKVLSSFFQEFPSGNLQLKSKFLPCKLLPRLLPCPTAASAGLSRFQPKARMRICDTPHTGLLSSSPEGAALQSWPAMRCASFLWWL